MIHEHIKKYSITSNNHIFGLKKKQNNQLTCKVHKIEVDRIYKGLKMYYLIGVYFVLS